jgi:PEP-CTERM motif-containing protein
MKRSIVLILLVLGFLPAKAFADGITCTVTGTNAVTIMESATEEVTSGDETCTISGVSLPSSAAVLDVLENTSDPAFDSSKPVSDYLNIDPSGNIVVKSDTDDMGLATRTEATVVGTEPLGFGSVVFSVGGTTYTFFSDVAPIPEPSTMLLFGSGLLALFARRKRQ